MGYETVLIIGNVYQFKDRDGNYIDPLPIVQPIATIDLMKAGYDTATGNCLAQYREIAEGSGEVYATWYASDGDTPTTDDKYGQPLSAVPIDALIYALECDHAAEPYRRFDVAIAMLRAFRDNPSWKGEYDDLRVIQYGH